MPRLGAALLCLLLLNACPGAAASLYQGSVIVTGMDLRSRPEGFARALRQVLTKLSGNPAWLDDDRVTGAAAAPLVSNFAYLDRESTIPKHDEQGSRDRPYDLLVRFDRAATENLLHGWGDHLWSADRPVIAVDLEVVTRSGDQFPIRADTDSDEPMRGALLAASERFGLEVAIPATVEPAPKLADSPRLTGRLRWDDIGSGWDGAWTLSWGSREVQYATRSDSFDQAFRAAIGGATSAMSGH